METEPKMDSEYREFWNITHKKVYERCEELQEESLITRLKYLSLDLLRLLIFLLRSANRVKAIRPSAFSVCLGICQVLRRRARRLGLQIHLYAVQGQQGGSAMKISRNISDNHAGKNPGTHQAEDRSIRKAIEPLRLASQKMKYDRS